MARLGLPLLCLFFCVAFLCAEAAPTSQYYACRPPNNAFPFCDATLSRTARVADLVSRLTTAEKVAQLANSAPAIDRLGVPAYQWWSEALHGVNSGCYVPADGESGPVRCPTSFPAPVAMAASFNLPLLRHVAETIAVETRAAFNLGLRFWFLSTPIGPDVWSPNINIFRDPRWGRGQETYGECPFLSSEFAVVMVRSLQRPEWAAAADARFLTCAATPKHFFAYSLEKWHGVDRHHFNAVIPPRDIWQTYLPAFQAAVQRGGAVGVMCSYNSVNGVPSCANSWLLRDVLRGQWGFDGYVTGDCDAVTDVWWGHAFARDSAAAAAAVLQAGTDTDCAAAFPSTLVGGAAQALAAGALNESLVTAAVSRLVDVRMRVGLFDPPELAQQPPVFASFGFEKLDHSDHRNLARDMARESLVLLKNDRHLLPLSAGGSPRVALIGPHVNSTVGLCSNYHGTLPHVVSLWEALSHEKGISLQTEPGCDIAADLNGGVAAAVAAAQQSDVVILALGIDTTVEDEDHDRESIALPAAQNRLLDAVSAVQRNVVVVLISGGVVGADLVKQKASAIVQAFYPGEEGGQAIADVLFGRVNPSGRLPLTMYAADFPDSVSFFSYDMREGPGKTYRFFTGRPLFEFGAGLSYSTFQFRLVSAPVQTVVFGPNSDAAVDFEVDVSNSGPLPGAIAVLSFISLRSLAAPGASSSSSSSPSSSSSSSSSPTQLVHPDCPLRQLFAFEKRALAVGEHVTVHVRVRARDAACVDKHGVPSAPAGIYAVTIGDAAAELHVFSESSAHSAPPQPLPVMTFEGEGARDLESMLPIPISTHASLALAVVLSAAVLVIVLVRCLQPPSTGSAEERMPIVPAAVVRYSS